MVRGTEEAAAIFKQSRNTASHALEADRQRIINKKRARHSRTETALPTKAAAAAFSIANSC